MISTEERSSKRPELNVQYEGPKGYSSSLFSVRVIAEWQDFTAGINFNLKIAFS